MWFFSVKSSAVSLMTLLSLQVCIAQISAVGTIFFDMETECFAPLLEADIDGNLKLNRMEYVKFIQLESQNELFQGGSLVHLPDQFSLQFNRLICFFGNDGEEFDGEDCLDDLPLDGADGEPTPDENVFLYEVCHQTKKAIYDTLNLPYPTQEPTVTPSEDVRFIRQVTVPFGVANLKGLSAIDVAGNAMGSLDDVIKPAFESLGAAVEENWNIEKIGGSRRLEVFSQSAYIDTIESSSCPQTILDETPDAKCQDFYGVFQIKALDEDADEAVGKFSQNAQTSISDGDFQALVSDKENYLVYSITTEETTSTFPLFAIVGVTAGAVLIGLFAGRALFVKNRTRGSQLSDDEMYSEDEFHTSRSGADIEKGVELEPVEMLGESVAIGTFRSPDKVRFDADDSSSNAGSSGWSSSAGVSSMNTGSVDSVEYFGSSLAAIGAASKVHTKYDRQKKGNMYPIEGEDENSESDSSSDHKSATDFATRQQTTREDLETQIEAADWAAVGATAAILANDHRSNSESSSGLSDSSSMTSSGLSSALSGTSRERARAAELDRLVDAGDWEGVVLTAAKFEGDDRDDKTYGSESAKDSNRSSADRSFANSSHNSPSVSTNLSDTLSNNLKRAEIRAEVESLVRRVVPDEIDNLDEMMSQFQGREEELLETLRTMQERSIAARQREASRRNAKREAKKLSKESKKAAVAPPRSKAATCGNTNDEIKPLVNPSTSMDSPDLPSKMDFSASDQSSQRAALDPVISSGGWEAVGKTAEQIGTHDCDIASNGTGSQGYLSSHSQADESERAAELTGLIQDKDWSGVVAAASNYNKTDAKTSGSQSALSDDEQRSVSSSGRWKTTSDIESDDGTEDPNRKKVNAKEEEEARAQAQMWTKIAEQSGGKDSTAVGASDAADWAISRKFKEIQDSEVDQNKTETQSVTSSNDDNSV